MSELHFSANALSRAEQRTGPDGRLYLVAPGVALVAGVVGDEFVPGEQLARHFQGWAGRPLTLGHPQRDGQHISANSPDLYEQVVVGRFWNPTFEDGKLKGEYWVDMERVKRMGGDARRILDRLTSNNQTENSTAYFRDFDPTPGEWDGKPYRGIARNLVPDHIAILINEIGKCSIADGCGLLANSGCKCGCSHEVDMSEKQEQTTAVEDAQPVVNKEKAPAKVEPVAKTEPVTTNGVTLEQVKEFVANATTPLQAKLTEYDQFFSDNGGYEAIRDVLQLAKLNGQAMAANARREKDSLITALVGNSRCVFSKDDLEKMDIEQLGKLAQSLQPVDYSGRSFGTFTANADEWVDELEEA